ncbi:flagellar hook-associated protein 2 [Nocardioides ginsengisegetis]|uniref:Flagellar hook-associated protein 2 n=1 Tax=Nocardioides ginsengisegetis TaxID=661491 RepID=A0A7W3J2C8_9ACTN|nr:flagellar filament capping protein FliD [Nocardioides ginsengisegetis]MBA8805006.1 flagellar hook-associated protein 2 [Nocardioides ginsengisegetis]
MATSSISGLASGLDTASIIDQLMQLEATSQNRLKTRQSSEKTVLSALQSLNTDVALLGSKAETLGKTETWQTLKATSSSTDITATAAATATPGSLAVKVVGLAAAHQFALTDAGALSDVVVSGGASAVRLTSHDGTFRDVPTGGGTLQEVVTAINGATADTGVTATAVKVADGSYRLLVSATKTGQASDFTLTNTDGSALLGGVDAASLRRGADAQVTVGGIAATSTTNTFTDLVPGVTVTLQSTATVGSTSTVTIARDTASVKAGVKGLVDQVNALLSKIDSQTSGKSGTTSAGALVGDGTARSLRSALLDTVFGSTGLTSMKGVGIQTDRYGKLVFDDAAFDVAYAADPAGVAAQFTKATTPANDGWAARLKTVATTYSDSRTGTLTSAVTGRQATIDRLGDDIDAWDGRLELRRTTLTRQFTALETALSSLQSQGNWLAGQIAHLPTSS